MRTGLVVKAAQITASVRGEVLNGLSILCLPGDIYSEGGGVLVRHHRVSMDMEQTDHTRTQQVVGMDLAQPCLAPYWVFHI